MRSFHFLLALLLSASAVLAEAPVFEKDQQFFHTFAGRKTNMPLRDLLKSYDKTQPITWRTSRIPAWLTWDPKEGVLSGVPPQVGERLAVRVEARQGKATAQGDFFVDVLQGADWKQKNLPLGRVVQGQSVRWDLNDFLNDPHNENPTFKVKDLPRWLALDAKTGVVQGTVPRDFIGPFKPQFSLGLSSNSAAVGEGVVIAPQLAAQPARQPGEGSGAALRGNRTVVAAPADAPIWLLDPLALPQAQVGSPFQYDLLNNVELRNGEAVQFRNLNALPAWMELAADGKLTGTPDRPGNFSFVVEISSQSGAVQGGVQGSVVGNDRPPVLQEAALRFTLKEREELSENLNQAKYVSGGSGPLEFKLSAPSNWASLSDKGALVLRPRFAQVGEQALAFEVTDGKHTVKGTLRASVVADPRKPQWFEQTVRLQGAAGTALQQSIANRAQDPDGRPLSFSRLPGGPEWLGVTAQGELFGTPAATHVGENRFALRAANGFFSEDAVLVVTVVQGNRPPEWTAQTVNLAAARANVAYRADLTRFANDPDPGDTVRFAKVAGPAWAAVTREGILAGIPRPGDQGRVSLRVSATDSKDAVATATLQFSVEPAPQPPKWVPDQPISLGDVPLGRALNVDLTQMVEAEPGADLTFRKERGPDWLVVEPEGKISGTPTQEGQLGNYTVVVRASDGDRTSDAGFSGRVSRPNQPPRVNLAALVFEVAERRIFTLNLAQAEYVNDPDGDPLAFSLAPTGWASLSRDGTLTLRPTFSQVGAQTLRFDVTDGKDAVEGEIRVTVTREARPPRWKADPIKLTARAGVPFVASLRENAEDLDGLALTFSRQPQGPGWLTVDANGRIHGTPTDENAGENTLVVKAHNDKLSASAALVVEVTSDNSPPQWTKRPIVLKAGRADSTYAQSLTEFATDADPDDELSFEMVRLPDGRVDGPDWAWVTTSGLVIGTPRENDVGLNVLSVRVRDSRRAFTDNKVHIQVASQNTPPRWVQIPVPLGNSKVGSRYQFDLSVWVEDVDADALSFKKIAGPAWLLVGTDGAASGTPTASDVGEFNATFEVSDGKSFVSVEALGKVLAGNKAPILREDQLVFAVGVDQEFSINLNDKKYVEDPEGDALSFALLSTLPWVSLSAEGVLVLRPTRSQRGEHSVALRVTDAEGSSTDGVIRIQVDEERRAPIWEQDPIAVNASADAQFQIDLNNYATDLAGLPIRYSKVSGPAWLVVNTSGAASGRPTAEHAQAPQVFVLEASNGFLSSRASLRVTVANQTRGDRYTLSRESRGARVELLFVVDHSPATAEYYDRLKREAPAFFTELDRKGVSYSIAVRSTRSFVREAAANSMGSQRLVGGDTFLVRDFAQLIDRTRGEQRDFHSPIWSMEKLFAWIPENPALYRNRYFEPEVPTLVYVHNFGFDEYKTLQRHDSPNHTPSVWGTNWRKYFARYQKPVRILVNEFSCREDVRESFSQLVGAVHGEVLSANPCRPPFPTGLDLFAKRVVSYANLYDVRFLGLTEKPRDLSKLQVKLRVGDKTHTLSGNTGQASDLWYYDARDNTIGMRWWNITIPVNPEKDALFVEY